MGTPGIASLICFVIQIRAWSYFFCFCLKWFLIMLRWNTYILYWNFYPQQDNYIERWNNRHEISTSSNPTSSPLVLVLFIFFLLIILLVMLSTKNASLLDALQSIHFTPTSPAPPFPPPQPLPPSIVKSRSTATSATTTTLGAIIVVIADLDHGHSIRIIRFVYRRFGSPAATPAPTTTQTVHVDHVFTVHIRHHSGNHLPHDGRRRAEDFPPRPAPSTFNVLVIFRGGLSQAAPEFDATTEET